MKIKTSELSGIALDWAVAKCEGLPIRHDPMNFGPAFAEGGFWIWDERGPIGKRDYRLIGRQYSPSNNWSQGGPIIERGQLCVGYKHQPDPNHAPLLDSETICWARTTSGGHLSYGPTPLVAAMRCFCQAKFGDEIEIPDELLEN